MAARRFRGSTSRPGTRRRMKSRPSAGVRRSSTRTATADHQAVERAGRRRTLLRTRAAAAAGSATSIRSSTRESTSAATESSSARPTSPCGRRTSYPGRFARLDIGKNPPETCKRSLHHPGRQESDLLWPARHRRRRDGVIWWRSRAAADSPASIAGSARCSTARRSSTDSMRGGLDLLSARQGPR